MRTKPGLFTTSLDDPGQVWSHAGGADRRNHDDGIGGLKHLPVSQEHRDTLAAIGAEEDQVAGERLRRWDLAAGVVLLARGTRHLDPDAGEGIQHETRSVESDDVGTWDYSGDAGTWVGAAGGAGGVAASVFVRNAALRKPPCDHVVDRLLVAC